MECRENFLLTAGENPPTKEAFFIAGVVRSRLHTGIFGSGAPNMEQRCPTLSPLAVTMRGLRTHTFNVNARDAIGRDDS